MQISKPFTIRTTDQQQHNWNKFSKQIQAFFFVLPTFVLFVIFLLYPIGYVVYLSFQRWNLLGIPQFIGLQNYATLLFQQSSFLHSIWVTIFFVILAVPAQIGLGLFLAILLEQKFKGHTFFRSVFFLPQVISYVAAGITFEWLFSTGANSGFIPQLLANWGLHFPDWQHTDGFWAMIVVVIMNTWKSTGFSMILYLAGLQSINPDYYRAAQVDGMSNAWQRFRYISWPLLAPTTTMLIITNTIGSFQAFVPFFVMTNGGPSDATKSLVFYIYDNFANQTGIASAATTLFLLGVLAITAIQLLAMRRQETYYY